MILIELDDFRDTKCPKEANSMIVDPPYNLGKNYGDFDDSIPYEDWVKELLKWSKTDWNLIFGPWVSLYDWLPRVPKPDRVLIWHRTFVQPTQTAPTWTYATTPILVYKTEKAEWYGPKLPDRDWHDCIDAHSAMGDIQTLERYFPQVRPKHPGMTGTAIATKLLEGISKPRDLIVDPMCGLGSILVAALRMGRQAWGCEINQEYRDFALSWIQKEGYSSTLYDFVELDVHFTNEAEE